MSAKISILALDILKLLVILRKYLQSYRYRYCRKNYRKIIVIINYLKVDLRNSKTLLRFKENPSHSFKNNIDIFLKSVIGHPYQHMKQIYNPPFLRCVARFFLVRPFVSAWSPIFCHYKKGTFGINCQHPPSILLDPVTLLLLAKLKQASQPEQSKAKPPK